MVRNGQRWHVLLEQDSQIVSSPQICCYQVKNQGLKLCAECSRRWHEGIKPDINRQRWSLYEVGNPFGSKTGVCVLTMELLGRHAEKSGKSSWPKMDRDR
jgi:hypothetical protein